MSTPDETRSTFKLELLIIFLARTALNASFRVLYPFLPSIARGLDISLAAASRLITLRVIAGLAAPFLGPMADRYGRRRMMEIALLLFTLASLLLAGLGTFMAAAIALTLYGLAKILYDPAVQAYVGDTVPYQQRGKAMGIVELSWSSAWLLGVPASGFLIERFGWRAPWSALVVLGGLGAWLTHVGLPSARNQAARDGNPPPAAAMFSAWSALLRRRQVVILLLVSLLLTLSNEIPFIVYGAWLETTFGLSLSTLGLASIVVGLAEAAAELGTTMFTDKLGKRRSVLVGLLSLTASLAALPLLARFGLIAGLIGVALMVLTFEFAIVSLLPLATEIAPDARASLLSLNITAFSLGRIVGAFVGGWLWQWQNMALQTAAGMACTVAALVLLARGIKELT